MSLLNESAATVIAGDVGTINQIIGTVFTNNVSSFYKVAVGFLTPLAAGNYLVVTQNNEPFQLPPNSIALKMFLLPETLLDSGDLNTSTIVLKMFSNPEFTGETQPWGFSGHFTGAQVNSKTYTECLENGSAILFGLYPYFGCTVTGPNFTAGTVKVIVFYITKPSN